MKCRRIYEESLADICDDCGRPTHRTNFIETAKQHKQWIADGKADWNVCPQGGTLRGWWSI